METKPSQDEIRDELRRLVEPLKAYCVEHKLQVGTLIALAVAPDDSGKEGTLEAPIDCHGIMFMGGPDSLVEMLFQDAATSFDQVCEAHFRATKERKDALH